MPYLTSYERFIPDAVELVFRDDIADTLDDDALSNAVMSMVAYLAHHQTQD